MHSSKSFPYLGRSRTLLYLLLAGVVSLPFLCLYPLIFVPKRFGLPVLLAFIRLQHVLLRVICGLRVEVVGLHNMPNRPCVIASAHDSGWETVFYHILLGNPAMFAKKELFDTVFLGRIMRANGHIEIDRRGSADAVMRSFRLAKVRLKQGRNILIFPTGTRAQAQRADIKAGTLMLYKVLKCPVVPVILNSGDFVLDKRGLILPGVIKVQILPAIPVGLAKQEFSDRLNKALARRPV